MKTYTKISLAILLILGLAALWIPRGPALPPGLTFAQINNPSGGGSGTVTATGGALTANAVVLGAGTTDTKVSTGITTNGASELDLGVVGTNGVLGLNGLTSGTAKFTAPAIAGTVTNDVVSSNGILFPAGTSAAPSVALGVAGQGFYQAGSTIVCYAAQGDTCDVAFNDSVGVAMAHNFGITWSGTSGNANLSPEAGISEAAAGIVAVGSGTNQSTTGKLKAAGYMSVGTKFTTNNGCTDQATTGGATAGKFQVGAAVTSCTEIITMGDTATAPNGWSCTAIDLTTAGDVTNPHQTATAATTATIVSGTVVAGDVIQFSCIGY